MVAEIDRVNTRHHDSGLVIGSTDAKALYPSMDINFTVEKVCDVIRQSTIIIRALHIAIKFIMKNHTYTFGNQIRKQSKNTTGAIAQSS